MHICEFLLVACVGFLASQVESLTNEEIIRTLKIACAAKNLHCPREKYANFVGDQWSWNETAIFSSAVAARLRDGDNYTPQALADIKKEYCCRTNECLKKCNIFPRKQFDLIRNYFINQHLLLDQELLDKQKNRVKISSTSQSPHAV